MHKTSFKCGQRETLYGWRQFSFWDRITLLRGLCELDGCVVSGLPLQKPHNPLENQALSVVFTLLKCTTDLSPIGQNPPQFSYCSTQSLKQLWNLRQDQVQQTFSQQPFWLDKVGLTLIKHLFHSGEKEARCCSCNGCFIGKALYRTSPS